ncbi:MAG: hypothetical protein KDJ50_10085 [Alphaproteobacteria bacterium]|nr:hypothetical protein [Alphaproteobacteria bacterium]
MVSVYSSTSGVGSTSQINRNDRTQNQHSNQLASGKKISKASDDAAGLAISAILGSDVAALKQSSSNLVQGTALLQIADGALDQAGNILQRMKSLSTQANSGALDTSSQSAINQEYQSLLGELNNLGSTTEFNGQRLLDGTFNANFQSGADGTNTLSADLTSIDLSSAGLGLTGAVGASATALSTQASAAATSAELDNAIANVANARSQVGATLSTFSTRGSVLETDTENLIADQSAIQDVDIGEASKNFKSSNLLSDASIAAEAQTNRLRSSVLQLVR